MSTVHISAIYISEIWKQYFQELVGWRIKKYAFSRVLQHVIFKLDELLGSDWRYFLLAGYVWVQWSIKTSWIRCLCSMICQNVLDQFAINCWKHTFLIPSQALVSKMTMLHFTICVSSSFCNIPMSIYYAIVHALLITIGPPAKIFCSLKKTMQREVSFHGIQMQWNPRTLYSLTV